MGPPETSGLLNPLTKGIISHPAKFGQGRLVQLAIPIVQNRHAGEQSRTLKRQTKEITISNYVSLLFVFSR